MMRKHRSWIQAGLLSTLGLFTISGVASAQSCADCPTPGACTADGICYPKRATWGHYRNRWSRWPGDVDDPIPVELQPEGEGNLPGAIPDIPARIENLQAPPPSDAEEDDEESAEGSAAGDDLPPLPPAVPPLGSPLTPDLDPPPALPTLPDFGAPSGPAPGPADGFSGVIPRQSAVQLAGGDFPPALPDSFGAVIQTAAVRPLPPIEKAPQKRVRGRRMSR